ncbi:MAG: response regulator [Acidobacteriota bacterium]
MSKTILVVDDSATDRRLITDALTGQGYEILTAKDGEEALEIAGQHLPQLVLLDIVMPGKNGFQVCRQIKSGAETRDTRVVLVSSKTQESDRFWGMKQGADGYLTKPFDDSELLATVAELL